MYIIVHHQLCLSHCYHCDDFDDAADSDDDILIAGLSESFLTDQ